MRLFKPEEEVCGRNVIEHVMLWKTFSKEWDVMEYTFLKEKTHEMNMILSLSEEYEILNKDSYQKLDKEVCNE